MKVYHECIKKGKYEAETCNDIVYFDKKEKKLIHEAMEEYVKKNKRKTNAKKLLAEMDSMYGY